MKTLITIERLREIVSYDPNTGIFLNLIKRGRRNVGDILGGSTLNGYIQLMLDGRMYLAHRLALFYMTGLWPFVSDHKNGIKSDNRFGNIRAVSYLVNNQNCRRAPKHSSTGLLGASFENDRFVSRIRVGGKCLNLGRFDTAVQAHEAYVSAKRRYHEGNTL